MRVVFMGTPDFAVGALEAIVQAGHSVVAVVTQPDKPRGRGKEMQYTPVKEYALSHQIPVLQPNKIKSLEAIAELRKHPADIFVVAAFGQIVSKEILEMPPLGCINIHASLLPKYRGAAPIQWAVINGEATSGITIMQMNEGLDTGNMLFTKAVLLDAKETGESLHDKLRILGAELITEALDHIEKGEITPVAQEDAQSTYAKRLTKDLGRIDWQQEAVVIERLIRGLNSWPSAYTVSKGKTLKIWEADVLEDTANLRETLGINKLNSVPFGIVVKAEKDMILVNTGKDYLQIKSLQLEGKKRMSAKEFLLGNSLTVGSSLGE